MAEVSIVIPVYNVEKYLSRCVDSVLKQTYIDFQVILVDDGSPDNCAQICEDYKTRDNRVFVIHRENGGLSAARNSGIEWVIKNKSTNWITFIDSDDWVHPQYLELLLGAANDSKDNIIVSDFCITNQSKISYKKIEKDYKRYNTQDFFVNNDLHPISACGRLFKTSDFSSIRFPEGRLHEDRFTTYKIIFRYENIIFVRHQLYYCYDNSESLTRVSWNPNRLDDIVAIEEQIKHFRNSNYQSVYLHLLYDYLDLLLYSLKRTKDNRSYKKHEINLRNKLRKFRVVYAGKIELEKNKKTEIFKYSYPFIFRVCRKLSII